MELTKKTFSEFIHFLQKQLQSPLPGAEAQEIMAPSFRNDFHADRKKMRESGVMLLLYPKNGMPHFVLMKRSTALRNHSGQISLPGGSVDKTDANYIETAIRETHEEIGIALPADAILGTLSSLFIPISNFMVYPVVAYIEDTPNFLPNPNEVESIVEISVEQLCDKHAISTEQWETKGKKFLRPFYKFNNQEVWGATAMILSEFKALLSRK